MNVEYFKHRPYEDADADGYSGAFKTRDYDGVAWRVIGWELEPLSTWQCCDCGACGYERDGGGALLDHCIVRLRTAVGKRTIWEHPSRRIG